MSEKYTNELIFILKKYIPNIDIQNPIIKYQIDRLIIKISYISNLLFPLKSIFQINNCKNNYSECLKEIYSLYLKYYAWWDFKVYWNRSFCCYFFPSNWEFYYLLIFLDNSYAIMNFRNYANLSNLTHYFIGTKNTFDVVLSCFLFFSFLFMYLQIIILIPQVHKQLLLLYNTILLYWTWFYMVSLFFIFIFQAMILIPP